MKKEELIADLLSEYMKSVGIQKTENKPTYSATFMLAWILYGQKGDKQKAFKIWEKEGFDKYSVMTYLENHLPASCFRKEDLKDFEDFLADPKWIRPSIMFKTTSMPKDNNWFKRGEKEICVGDLIEALSLYPKRTKLVACCICYGADTPNGTEEWDTYLYGLKIENINGKNFYGNQVKGIRIVFEDDNCG